LGSHLFLAGREGQRWGHGAENTASNLWSKHSPILELKDADEDARNADVTTDDIILLIWIPGLKEFIGQMTGRGKRCKSS
jgi:hypothetical protein